MWSPIGEGVKQLLDGSGQRLRLVICPFIQAPALAQLIKLAPADEGLVVITRWTNQDIVSGVSDLAVYPLLEGMDIPLYVHPTIHMKLYVLSDGSAIQGSCNLTQRGFGWAGTCNVETALHLVLGLSDWRQINQILGQSLKIDRAAYDIVMDYKRNHAKPEISLPPLELPLPMGSNFSLLSLPASCAPEILLEGLRTKTFTPELSHDMVLFGFDEESASVVSKTELRARYRRLPIVVELVTWLETKKAASFGEVSKWLHTICTDRPLPYRSTIKDAVQNLYQWLPFAFDQVRIDRPRHSELLVWDK